MAEVDAWLRQYPDAWLAVDMRVGVIPPAVHDLEGMLRTFPRIVIIIVFDDTVTTLGHAGNILCNQNANPQDSQVTAPSEFV